MAILVQQQTDARQNNDELASRVGLSAASCWQRVRALEETGFITGYRAEINRHNRGIVGTTSNNSPMADIDPANPRYWDDSKGVTSQNATAVADQRGNVNGHVMRVRETGDNAAAETFSWDIFLLERKR